MDVVVFLVEEDGIGFRERVKGFQDIAQGRRALCAVEDERALHGLDELRLTSFQDARGARVFGLAV